MERQTATSTDCEGAPPSRATVYSRTLQRACEVLGGPQLLAHELRVSLALLASWLDARGEPPIEVFLRAVDIVLLHAGGTRGSA